MSVPMSPSAAAARGTPAGDPPGDGGEASSSGPSGEADLAQRLRQTLFDQYRLQAIKKAADAVRLIEV